MKNKSSFHSESENFSHKHLFVHRFEQELSRFHLTGVTWQFAVTPYFLSESAIEEQGHRTIRSRGKVFLKFPTHPHQLSVNNKKFLLLLFYFSDRVLPLSETYRHGWRKAKIATQRIHIMLSYFNGFIHRLSFCSQGQLLPLFIWTLWFVGILWWLCVYISGLPLTFAGGPLSPSRGRTICQTKQSIKAYCLLFVYFYTVPNSLG